MLLRTGGRRHLRLRLPLPARRAVRRRRAARSSRACTGTRSARAIAALGPGCRDELAVGQLVALWPLLACGHCYPCSVGRPNTCDNFKLIGIHLDGGLQQQLVVGQEQVFPIDVENAGVAAMVEPLSIAVQAVRRAARAAQASASSCLGPGRSASASAWSRASYGAEVLVVDLQSQPAGAQRASSAPTTLVWTERRGHDRRARASWAGPDGPPVVFDATGAAAAVEAMVEMVSSAGRAVQVGMSNQEVSLRIGLLTEKELDLLGVSCCDSDGFAEAVRIAERNAARRSRAWSATSSRWRASPRRCASRSTTRPRS